MKATKEYYLIFRSLFIRMGFEVEVSTLDRHFNLVFLKNKTGQIIKIL